MISQTVYNLYQLRFKCWPSVEAVLLWYGALLLLLFKISVIVVTIRLLLLSPIKIAK